MKYVVIGSSAAGINGVRELRRLDGNAEIVMISKDEQIYSRCILHHYLGGKRNVEQLNFAENDFAEKFRIEWIKGKACIKVNPGEHTVELEDGSKVSYDKLLIATGAGTFIPPVKGIGDAKNVIGFRNLDDIEKIKEAVKSKENIVVMGAGLVGLDAADGLLEIGVKPVIVELEDHLLIKQLDKKSAAAYEEAFTKQGVKQYYGVSIREVKRNKKDEISAIVLSTGEELTCDYLIVTAGVRSNVAFLEGSGVETDKFGLLFDEHGKTNMDDIYGAGDVSGRAPIWPAAVKEGIVAAGNMAGEKKVMTDFFDSKSTMNFQEIATMSLGSASAPDDGYLVDTEETEGSYKKIIHKDGKITGAILQGDLSYGGILQQLIANKIDVSKVKKSLFDVDYSDFFNIKANFEYFYEEGSDE